MKYLRKAILIGLCWTVFIFYLGYLSSSSFSSFSSATLSVGQNETRPSLLPHPLSRPLSALRGPSSIEAKPPQPKTTCIILFGELRGGEQAWQSLYKNLLENNNADLALVFSKSTTNTSNTSSLYQRATYIWEIPEYNDDWSTLAYDATYGPGSGTFFKSLTSVPEKAAWSAQIQWFFKAEALRHLYASKLATKYDRFVLTRPGLYYSCDLDLTALDNGFIWVPEGQDWDGVNDRQMIIPRSDLNATMGIIATIQRDPSSFVENLPKPKHASYGINSEQILKQVLKMNNVLTRVKRYPPVAFLIREPGDRSRWKQGIATNVSGVGILTVKYPGEQKLAQQTCTTPTPPTTNTGGVVIEASKMSPTPPTPLSDQKIDWKPYRLADIIKNAGYKGVSYQALLKTYTQKFPNSIATEYLTKNHKRDFNEKLFLEIIENRMKLTKHGHVNYFIPVAVVHLRLGDVMNNASKQFNMYSKYYHKHPNDGYRQYVYPYQYYNSLVKKIPRNVKTICLVGSTAHSKNKNHVRESKKYVILVTQYFISKGYKVTPRIDTGATPDEDFLYMASSTFFVQSGGGYSKFIAKIVKLRGGQVMFKCLCPPLCKCK